MIQDFDQAATRPNRGFLIALLTVVWTLLLMESWASGQVILNRLRDARARIENRISPPPVQRAADDVCPLIVRAEAWLGQPFGVGMVSFRLPPGEAGVVEPSMLIRTGGIRVDDEEGRLLYPAEGQPPAARFFRNVFGPSDDPSSQLITTWFLFRGDTPLRLNVRGCDGTALLVVPQIAREKQYQRMLEQWWREYTRIASTQKDQGDYPDLIETYLTSMLEHRQGIAPPGKSRDRRDPLQETLNLLMDAESIRSDLVKDWFRGEVDTALPNQQPPQAVGWNRIPGNAIPGDVPVEPMSMVIPDDCFYLRFGTWENQIWLKKLTEEYGGDLGRMLQLRGQKATVDSKFLNQLALESSQIDEWFGGSLIRDVAVIGRDTLFGSGPSVGVLLESSDTNSLQKRINARREKFNGNGEADVQTVAIELAGEKATLLSSADNRFRSFYVVQGDHHLFTNSRKLAERFIMAAKGEGSMGRSDEFRYARMRMPLSRNDTIFIYFPAEFFRQLLSPSHQIELLRRSRIVTEMQIVQLARSAAANEGYPNAPLEFLVMNGFLPNEFGNRPAGSTLVWDDRGWIDSVRGRHGFFLPVADMQLEGVTPGESEWYREKTSFFFESVKQLEPMMIGLRRFAGEGDIEQVVIDAHLAPFGQKEFGWIDTMLGPPLKQYIVGPDNDVIRFQISMQRDNGQSFNQLYQLFGAVQDRIPPDIDLQTRSWLDLWRTLKQIPGYIGTTPPAGLADWLPRLGGQPDAGGYTHSRLLGVSRLQFDDYSLLSFDPIRLEPLRTSLKTVPAERAAQIRISVADLSRSNLGDWVNLLNYRRAWQTSVANVRLLNTLIEQFGVAPSKAREFAESLLDVRLICALDGEYVTVGDADRPVWVSTAWPSFSSPAMPDEFASPLLVWFRGLELEINRVDTHYEVHGILRVKREKSSAPLSLPAMDLLRGFGDLLPGFGSSTKKPDGG